MQTEKIVLAVDLDGTLLIDSENNIHPQDVMLLKTGLPLPLIIATGRSLMSTRYPFEKNGLFDSNPLPYPLVLNNGGLLFAPYEVVKAQYPFLRDVAAELICIASAHTDVTFLIRVYQRFFNWAKQRQVSTPCTSTATSRASSHLNRWGCRSQKSWCSQTANRI